MYGRSRDLEFDCFMTHLPSHRDSHLRKKFTNRITENSPRTSADVEEYTQK